MANKLLYIEASPRKSRSCSIRVSKAFIDAYALINNLDLIETLDLWDTSLPEMDGSLIEARYAIMYGQSHTPGQAHLWQSVHDLFLHFDSADKYLISIPMWNFGIPYRLKHYIDLITQPGMSFQVGANGYEGLVKNKPVVVIYARGGTYPDDSAIDFQKRYIEHWLAFIGFTRIHSIIVDSTLQGTGEPESMSAAIQKVRFLAGEI